MKGNKLPVPILTLESQIKRKLRKHLKMLGYSRDQHGMLSKPNATKDGHRALHAAQRKELIEKEYSFINYSWPKYKKFFANGIDVHPGKINPQLEVIKGGTWQSDLFRLASLTWSIPVSKGYGRRIRYLVWDESNGKIMGIIALGDPVFNLKVRDEWIGWDVNQRREKLVNILDAYVLGALPPYSHLLGGKLIACLTCTKNVKDDFACKYGTSRGLISGIKKRAQLCLITTTSALGKSSLYNRLTLNNKTIFNPIGYTSGWGHFHIPDELFHMMREYLESVEDSYASNHQYGDGPNWKLRVVKKAFSRIGINPDLLRHGISREVFVASVATNSKAVLKGEDRSADYKELSTVNELADHALDRWIIPRSKRKPEYKNWLSESLLKNLRTGAIQEKCSSSRNLHTRRKNDSS